MLCCSLLVVGNGTQGVSADLGAGMSAMHWSGIRAPLGWLGTFEVYTYKGTSDMFFGEGTQEVFTRLRADSTLFLWGDTWTLYIL